MLCDRRARGRCRKARVRLVRSKEVIEGARPRGWIFPRRQTMDRRPRAAGRAGRSALERLSMRACSSREKERSSRRGDGNARTEISRGRRPFKQGGVARQEEATGQHDRVARAEGARQRLRVCRLVDPRNASARAERRGPGDATVVVDAGRVGGADGGRSVRSTDRCVRVALTRRPNSPSKRTERFASRPSRITASNDDDDDDLLAIRSTARDVFAAVAACPLAFLVRRGCSPSSARARRRWLTLAAFFPPADDRAGGFRLGVVYIDRMTRRPPALPPLDAPDGVRHSFAMARVRFGGDSDGDENQQAPAVRTKGTTLRVTARNPRTPSAWDCESDRESPWRRLRPAWKSGRLRLASRRRSGRAPRGRRADGHSPAGR